MRAEKTGRIFNWRLIRPVLFVSEYQLAAIHQASKMSYSPFEYFEYKKQYTRFSNWSLSVIMLFLHLYLTPYPTPETKIIMMRATYHAYYFISQCVDVWLFLMV